MARVGLVIVLWLSFANGQLHAASATWSLNPASGDWNDSLNWSPNAVPNGPTDIASFGLSKVTSVFLSANVEVDGIVFNPAATAYTITARPTLILTFSGTGITNNSKTVQSFVADVDGSGHSGAFEFRENASAGGLTEYTCNGAQVPSAVGAYGGSIFFRDNSNAGQGMFNVRGGMFEGAAGGFTGFYNGASAANGRFTVGGGAGRAAIGGTTEFHDFSTAGNSQFLNQGSAFYDGGALGGLGSSMSFHQNSTAGSATISNEASRIEHAGGAVTKFFDNSNAGSSRITNYGGMVSFSSPGGTGFLDNATAAESTIVNNGSTGPTFGGGRTGFSDTSSAGNATLIANGGSSGGSGGTITFADDSDGGSARIQLFGNGTLDISPHSAQRITIGSLESDGIVYLGARSLAVGSNNLNTVFSGTLQDGGSAGGIGGSLIKIGNGTFTLTGVNTYTGVTSVQSGTLAVNGSIASAATVTGGVLSGNGFVGSVTVNSGGTFSPGDGRGILNVAGDLILTLGATCLIELGGTSPGSQYDRTTVTGMVSLEDVTLSLQLGFVPHAGDNFIIIENDGPGKTIGGFLGLPEGSSFTAEGETFTISYRGGDGNDVVLTSVVPEPATSILLFGGAILAVLLKRRRETGN